MTTPVINYFYDYITEQDIKLIISKYCNKSEDITIQSYSVKNASNFMLGFLCEYLKLIVRLENRKELNFFIKAISKTNKAKADMVREIKLFENERQFYSGIKKRIEIPGIKPWSARYITGLNDAMVFEDLIAKQYKLRNKFERFDEAHTIQALRTLARFHATSIIFEEKRKRETRDLYKITDDYGVLMGKGGYHMSSEWYVQCMTGSLEALKRYSKYDEEAIKMIERHWYNVWSTAVDSTSFIYNQKNVICHRDLWNNNLMFHYKKGENNDWSPDDCLFVDFQAIRYQPPASDVMVLLCCNLDPEFRKQNIYRFLHVYYNELDKILGDNDIEISNILTKEDFVASAEEQTKWGLVMWACLIPQLWLDEELTTQIYCDNVQFNEILCKNKGMFIKKMIENNDGYRLKVMETFEELADTYCFNHTIIS